jgi:hypothetical protein
MRTLGFRGGFVSPLKRKRALLIQAIYHTAHRKQSKAADARYRAKVKAKYGTVTNYHKYLYAFENQAKKRAERKAIVNEYLNTPLLQPRLQKFNRGKRPPRKSPIRRHHPTKA